MTRLALPLLASAALLVAGAVRAETPPAAKALMARMQLAPEIARDWESDQAVPPAWLDGAKTEGKLRIAGSWDGKIFRDMTRPFAERYPFVKLDYQRGSNDTRVRAIVIAYGEGRILTDLVTGIDSSLNDFRSMDALADLRDLPNLANIPEAMRSSDGSWASARLRYWCFAYNPTLISAAEMPRRWEDLPTNAKLGGGRLALWRGVASWLLPLWHFRGAAWATDYVRALFTQVQPQRRKEGSRALVNLVAAGEFDASLAAAEFQVKDRAEKGAPVGFHCPDVVPIAASTLGVLKGNPDINASRLFLNWLLSKEGQLSQYGIEGAPPIHKDLQGKGFMPFPDEVAGKQIAFRSPEQLDDEIKAMFAVLTPLWEASASASGD
jgi:ABC-type Fe3+ transport system substrate-binding protein